MNCINCGKIFINRQVKYCSSQCQQDYQQKHYILAWKNGDIDGLSGEYQLSKRIRTYLLKKHNYQCESCGWGKQNPYTKTIPLEVHHKDGNYKNNSEDNLQVLCPNCHSLTENYKSANKNGRSERRKYLQKKKEYFCKECGAKLFGKTITGLCANCCSKTQRIATRPERKELKELIRTIPFTKIGEKYNVSDNAIRKWCDLENLPRTKKEINSYSDEEWNLI